MSELTERLDAIQKRAETSADGNFIQRALQESAVIHEDVPYLLDLVRKHLPALDGSLGKGDG